MEQEGVMSSRLPIGYETLDEALAWYGGEALWLAGVRFVTCDACGGDGGHETRAYRMDYYGNPMTGWQKCEACSGVGELEVETEPVECDEQDQE